jgi:pentatricopeptide repeat protein
MQHAGVAPDVRSFNALLRSCRLRGEWEEALALFNQLKVRGCGLCVTGQLRGSKPRVFYATHTRTQATAHVNRTRRLTRVDWLLSLSPHTRTHPPPA